VSRHDPPVSGLLLQQQAPRDRRGYDAPDFEALAKAYGISSATVEQPLQVGRALEEMWRDPAAPYLLQVMIDTYGNVYPKIAFGKPMSEMEPFATPIEMEGT